MDKQTADELMCIDVITTAHLLTDLMSRRLAPFGVTIGQLPALLALYNEEGLTQSELARRTGVEQPTMAITVRRMERDGLIVRAPDPSDHRKSRLRLTARAQEIREPLQQQRATLDDVSLEGFSDKECAALRALLARMTVNLLAAAGD